MGPDMIDRQGMVGGRGVGGCEETKERNEREETECIYFVMLRWPLG